MSSEIKLERGRHPQFFRDDTAEQRAIDSIGTGHWLRDFLARLVRVLQSIAKKKR